MPTPRATKRNTRDAHATWKLEDAKARFSEVVRRAHVEGPQAVTVRGRRAVVVLDAEEYERLAVPRPALPLVSFLESLDLAGLDLVRDSDTGRDIEL